MSEVSSDEGTDTIEVSSDDGTPVTLINVSSIDTSNISATAITRSVVVGTATGVVDNGAVAENDSDENIESDGESASENTVDTANSGSSCCICMDAHTTHTIEKCGHTVVCCDCYDKIDRCPICRTEIGDMGEVIYLTDAGTPRQQSRKKFNMMCSVACLCILMNFWCWLVLMLLGVSPIDSAIVAVFIVLCTFITSIKICFKVYNNDSDDAENVRC